VGEKLVKCCRKFRNGYYDETYHYLIEQHLNYLDIPTLTALRIFENIHHPNDKIITLYFLLFAELPPHINSKLENSLELYLWV
jgi:hypothetical protein